MKNYSGQLKKALRFEKWLKNRSANCPPAMYLNWRDWERLYKTGGAGAVAGALCSTK